MWTVTDVLVDPYPFYCIRRKWIDQNKKGYGLTKTSLTVHAVSPKYKMAWKESLQLYSQMSSLTAFFPSWTVSIWLCIFSSCHIWMGFFLLHEPMQHLFSCYPLENSWSPSSIYSCFIGHIWDHEFYHLGCWAVKGKFLKQRNFCLSTLIYITGV